MTRGASALRRLVVLAALGGLTAGCATVDGRDPRDPLEPWNRSVFRFNEAADRVVLKPVATAYRDVVPSLVRKGITNVYRNFSDAWSAVNAVLQLKPASAAHNTLRVAVNTVFGLGGLIDLAGEAGIPSHPEDFGQTLGRWGVPPGPYLVWPILGSSTVRDSVGLPLDMQATPNLLVTDAATRHVLTGVNVVNTRARLLEAGQLVEEASLDKYLFMRDGYLQRRRSLVYDGEPPEEAEEAVPEERWDEEASEPGTAPQAAAAAASGASAPEAAASAAAADLPASAAQPAEAGASAPAPAASADDASR